MKSLNSKITIEVSPTSITFKSPNESRSLVVDEFHHKAQFRMIGPKGFKVLDAIPKLRNEKNILILDVGQGFYDVQFICKTVDEMKARIEELKNYLTNIYNEYKKLIEKLNNYTSKQYIKPYIKKDDDFSKINIPSELSDLGDKLMTEKFNKTEDEYIKNLIDIWKNGNSFISKNGYTDFTKEFKECLDGIYYLRSKKS